MDSRSLPRVPLSWFGTTLWRYWPHYFEIVTIAICLRLLGLVEPFIFQVLIDRVLPFEREATLLVVCTIFMCAALFEIGFGVLSSRLGFATASNVTRELGSRLYRHLLALPYSFHRRWDVGEIATRLGETDTIRAFLVGVATGATLDIAFVLLYLGVLLTLSPSLTLVVLIALPLQTLTFYAFGSSLRRRLKVQFDRGADQQQKSIESIIGIRDFKALGAEDVIHERITRSLARTLHAGLKVNNLSIATEQLISLIERITTIAVLYFGALLVFEDQLTLGQLIAFHLVAGKVAEPISNFTGLWESWQNLGVSRARLGDILSVDTEGRGNGGGSPSDTDGATTRLELDGVTFAYDEGVPVLDDVSLSIPTRTMTLLVGPSGAGKSTLGRLVAGLERPSGGRVLLDGRDVADLPSAERRHRIGYLPQDAYFVSGTVRENLLVARPDATEEQIARALRLSVSERFVASLRHGLETDIGHGGASLSGGQRQRLALARTLLTDAEVVILDEPTSSLDELSRGQLITHLESLSRERTVVVITHDPEAFSAAGGVIRIDQL